MATGYTVLANGGYRVEPYFMERIVDSRGEVLFEAEPLRVCPQCPEVAMEFGGSAAGEAIDLPVQGEALNAANTQSSEVADSQINEDKIEVVSNVAPRVIDAQNIWLMNSMLRDVVRYGTGRKAMALGRNDLAGKTGTTNDQQDAWFSGFNPTLVATAWVGFDQLAPLGRREFGSAAALPMWMTFMKKALDNSLEVILEEPEGIVSVRIDQATGLRVPASFPDAIFESFRIDHVPEDFAFEQSDDPLNSDLFISNESSGGVTEELF